MSGTPYDQSRSRVRLEWGPVGGAAVTDAGTYAVVVDVLSFTTTVSVAVDSGVDVLPWRWADRGDAARSYADEHAAVVATGRAEARRTGGPSLSPASLRAAPDDLRRVLLPSPNGATTALALAGPAAGVVAGSLRNRAAVASWLADRLTERPGERPGEPGASVALVPAGERWADGSLRPALEDLLGAGAVLDALVAVVPDLDVSPEADAALAAWRRTGDLDPGQVLAETSSGRELAGNGYDEDVAIAAEVDRSDAVPLLAGTSFVPATGMRVL